MDRVTSLSLFILANADGDGIPTTVITCKGYLPLLIMTYQLVPAAATTASSNDGPCGHVAATAVVGIPDKR